MSINIAKCFLGDKKHPQLKTTAYSTPLKLSFSYSHGITEKVKLLCNTSMNITFAFSFCTNCCKNKNCLHMNVEVTLKYLSNCSYVEIIFEMSYISLLRNSYLKMEWYLLQSNKIMTQILKGKYLALKVKFSS